MNFPKNLKFKSDRIKEIIMKIDLLFSHDNPNYEHIIDLLNKLKEIPSYKEYIDDKDLEYLELIQLDSYTKSNKFLEGFDSIGSFYELKDFYSESGKFRYQEYLNQMKKREEEI